MHETGLVQNIIEIVEQEIDKHGIKKIASVHLSAGVLSCVVPEQMTFCFEILKMNSCLADAELKIEMVPITYGCPLCRKEFTAEGITLHCPYCLSERLELITGRELQISYLEVID